MYGSGLRLKSIGLYEAKKRPKDRKAFKKALRFFICLSLDSSHHKKVFQLSLLIDNSP